MCIIPELISAWTLLVSVSHAVTNQLVNGELSKALFSEERRILFPICCGRSRKTNYFNMCDLLVDACDHPCCNTVLLYNQELNAKEQELLQGWTKFICLWNTGCRNIQEYSLHPAGPRPHPIHPLPLLTLPQSFLSLVGGGGSIADRSRETSKAFIVTKRDDGDESVSSWHLTACS